MRRGWFHLASGAGVGRVFGFVSNLLLSRWLGPNDLGLFNLVTTTVQTSDILVRCGGDYAINFELGGQPKATKTEHGLNLARGFGQLCSLTTVFICVAVFVWVWWGHGLFPISLPVSQRFSLCSLLLVMIACEGTAAAAWELLLVTHRTGPLALRQGLFVPLRLLLASLGALYGGVLGAMGGWIFIALVQLVWLRGVLGHLWRPLQIYPLLWNCVRRLLRRGLPFYVANLSATIIFYPLLLKVAASSGLAEIGYLRVGQILQQVFAFLPSTLVPILFLKLRGEPSFPDQVLAMERPFRTIWFFLLEALLLYCVIDQLLIGWLFGASFISALLPTRILLITSLFECLSQLLVQPFLASGKVRIYGALQNGAAVLSAVLGWIWIPIAGLQAYLIVRLIYVLLPLIGYAIPAFQNFHAPKKLYNLILGSIAVMFMLLTQSLTANSGIWLSYLMLPLFCFLFLVHFKDAMSLRQLLLDRKNPN